MASAAVIGALRVVLGLDTASFETGLKAAGKTAQNFGAAIDRNLKDFAKLGAAVSLATAAIGAFVKTQVKFAADLDDTAERLGINVEALQELSYAAKLAGVDQEDFVKALEQFNKRMGEFKDGVSEAESALGQLGIKLSDLKGLTTDQQLRKVADGFAQIENPARQAAISADLFGAKIGIKMLNALKDGSAGLARMSEEARKLGFVLSKETIAQAAKADDEFDRLGSAMRVAGVQIAAGFLPALVSIREAVTSQAFQEGVKKLAAGIGDLVTWMVNNTDTVIKFSSALLGLKLGLSLGAAFGPAGAAIGGLAGGVAGFTAGAALAEKAAESFAGGVTKITVNAKNAAPAIEKVFDPKFADAAKNLQFEIAKLDGSLDTLPEGFADLGKSLGLSLEQLKQGFAGLGAQGQELLALQAQLNVLRAIDQGKSPYEKDVEAIEKLKVSLGALGLSAEKQGEITRKVAENMASNWKKATSDIASNLASGFAALASVNKKFAFAAKAAAYAEAIWNTYLGASKALALYGPTPIGFAAAAAAVVAGLGYVAKINAQSFAGGGSFKVPGGISGTDNKFVPLNLASGEMVSVTPAQKVDAQQGGGGAQEITLRTRGIGEMLTMDDLRGIVTLINQGTRDGYRLKIA